MLTLSTPDAGRVSALVAITGVFAVAVTVDSRRGIAGHRAVDMADVNRLAEAGGGGGIDRQR